LSASHASLAVALYSSLGVPGLALAFSISCVTATGNALVVLGPRIGGLRLGDTWWRLARMVGAGIVSAVLAWIVVTAIGSAGFTRALVALVAGAAVLAVTYLVLLVVLGVDEVQRAVRLVLRRGAPAV